MPSTSPLCHSRAAQPDGQADDRRQLDHVIVAPGQGRNQERCRAGQSIGGSLPERVAPPASPSPQHRQAHQHRALSQSTPSGSPAAREHTLGPQGARGWRCRRPEMDGVGEALVARAVDVEVRIGPQFSIGDHASRPGMQMFNILGPPHAGRGNDQHEEQPADRTARRYHGRLRQRPAIPMGPDRGRPALEQQEAYGQERYELDRRRQREHRAAEKPGRPRTAVQHKAQARASGSRGSRFQAGHAGVDRASAAAPPTRPTRRSRAKGAQAPLWPPGRTTWLASSTSPGGGIRHNNRKRKGH